MEWMFLVTWLCPKSSKCKCSKFEQGDVSSRFPVGGATLGASIGTVALASASAALLMCYWLTLL